MNLMPKNRKTLAVWVIGTISACILIFLGVQNITTVANAISWMFKLIYPMILGFAFALILNVPMRFFESKLFQKTKKHRLQCLRRLIAYIISLTLILIIITLVIWLVIPELVQAIKIILNAAIETVNTLSKMNESELSELPFGKFLLDINWNSVLSSLESWIKSEGANIISTAIGTISVLVSSFYNFLLAFVFSVYVLFNKEKLKSQTIRLIRVWLPKKFGSCFIHVATVVGSNFRYFVSGQTLEAVILGVLCMVGMFILQIPYAPMVGVLVGVTALIPIVGAFIGAGVGAFMILTISPVKAIVFIIFLLVLQQIEGNLIYPKVMGSRVNLPAMWVLAAVTAGGGIAGPIGMLLSVPIASSFYILLREATELREKKLSLSSSNPAITKEEPKNEE